MLRYCDACGIRVGLGYETTYLLPLATDNELKRVCVDCWIVWHVDLMGLMPWAVWTAPATNSYQDARLRWIREQEKKKREAFA